MPVLQPTVEHLEAQGAGDHRGAGIGGALAAACVGRRADFGALSIAGEMPVAGCSSVVDAPSAGSARPNRPSNPIVALTGGDGTDQLLVDLHQQTREVDRLGVVVVAPGRERFLTVARHGVGGQRDDGGLAELWVGFKGAGDGPSVHDRQVHVEQDDVRPLARGLVDRLLSVGREDHVEAAPLEPPRQKVQISS